MSLADQFMNLRTAENRHQECREYERSDPDKYAECLNELDPNQAYEPTGLNVILFTTIMNSAIPTIIAAIALDMHLANHNYPEPPRLWFWEWFKEENREVYYEWYRNQPEYPYIVTAWASVAGTHDLLWSTLNTMFFFWQWFGWFEGGIEWYIEHMLSNNMWWAYAVGFLAFAEGIVRDDDDAWSYLSLFMYSFFAYSMAKFEVLYGT